MTSFKGINAKEKMSQRMLKDITKDGSPALDYCIKLIRRGQNVFTRCIDVLAEIKQNDIVGISNGISKREKECGEWELFMLSVKTGTELGIRIGLKVLTEISSVCDCPSALEGHIIPSELD